MSPSWRLSLGGELDKIISTFHTFETLRFGDAQKNMRKSERKIKELTFAADEDKKNHERCKSFPRNPQINHVCTLRMQALIDQMQGKVKSYKKQIEEAEEIAALNLAKFRQTQNSLGSAEERAEAGEAALAKSRLRARSASLGPVCHEMLDEFV